MRTKKSGGSKRRKKEQDVGGESDESFIDSVEEEELAEAEGEEDVVDAEEEEDGEEGDEDDVEDGEEDEEKEEGEEEEENEEEEEDEEDEENEEEEEDEDYELKNYGIALEMPKRKNRGKNLKKLIGEDLEKDEKFWNDSIWEEEEVDEEYVNSEGEEEYIDVTDSDFDDDEDEVDDDDEEEAERNERELDDEEVKRKKKKMFSYLEKLKKQTHNRALRHKLMKKAKHYGSKVLGGKYGAPLHGVEHKSGKKKKGEGQEEAAEALKMEGLVKKQKKVDSSCMVLNRSTRDTTRQKTEQIQKLSELRRIKKENRFKKIYENKKKQKSMQREMTREERLEEAKITEQYNLQSLLQLQAWEEEKKKYIENKRTIYHRPKNDKTFPSSENLKYELDSYYVQDPAQMANGTLTGSFLNPPYSNTSMAQNCVNYDNGVVESNRDVDQVDSAFRVGGAIVKDENSALNGEEVPDDVSDGNIKRKKSENDQVSKESENDGDADSKTKMEKSKPMQPIQLHNLENLDNLDQCEDLHIEYLNENDEINFGTHTKDNSKTVDDNVTRVIKKRKQIKTDREERQIYIVTDSNELNVYSNYNNCKEYLEGVRNKNNLCAITNLEGKYFDPLTKKYYNNAEAFKLLRFYHHQKTYDNINEQISMMVELFTKKLTEIEENTKNGVFDNV
ncbi:YL1 nuclear protein [Plasmodium cynomolgi strain B]|uniref:YL1 nuclear protein n=1 Tax=Plasmodium cynomolgi (strain B) TaxID=1120755 RepID=K6UWC4_PLACD|nr:YL1 nuclear protein [Plasmodium cynomolgi strain B]GAB67944.1 YL1 nuclear protein [Plasmodium cynomolgi strain B]